jgi:hypothetical protein
VGLIPAPLWARCRPALAPHPHAVAALSPRRLCVVSAPVPSVAILATQRRRPLVPCASRHAASITALDARRHRLLAPSPWVAARRRGAVGERGGRRRRRASLWRRHEQEKEEGRVTWDADSGRVFTGQAIYMDAVKKKERSRFDVRHDQTADKFGFTTRLVAGAPYIRLRF